MLLSVVTVTHNSSFVIEPFLQDLHADGSSVEVIIVDSGSEDEESTRQIAAKYGAVFVPIGDNVGYGSGSNTGASIAKAAWIAFINPDVKVRATDLLGLADTAARHGITCIGPNLSTSTGNEVPAARPLIKPFWNRRTPWSPEREGHLLITQSMSGCCMVISRSAFRSVGGFDPRFFMFAEEIDLHKRLAESGARLAVDEAVIAITDGGGSSDGVSRRWGAVQRSVSHVLYTRKHFGRTAGLVDVLYRLVELLVSSDFKPVRASLRQFSSEIRRSKQLRQQRS